MATVRIAARVKNGWALGGSLLARRQASKRLWEDPQRGCGEARQGYRCPRRSPGVCAHKHHGGRFLGQTLSVTGRSVRDERGESYEGARGGYNRVHVVGEDGKK